MRFIRVSALAPAVCLSVALALVAGTVSAACTSPAGVEGETVYNTDYAVMQFCDGTNWVSMAASGTVSEADPQVNSLTGNAWCKANSGGTAIDCVTTTVTATDFAAGTAAAPGFYVTGDSNTGFFQSTGDTLSLSAGGVEVLRVLNAASAVNYFTFTPSAGTSTVTLASAGTGATVPITIDAKGPSSIALLDDTTVSGTLTATTFSGSGASLTALNASNLASGTVATARLGSGTASSSTYLRGDGTWATPTSSVPQGTWCGNRVVRCLGTTPIYDEGGFVGMPVSVVNCNGSALAATCAGWGSIPSVVCPSGYTGLIHDSSYAAETLYFMMTCIKS